MKRLQIGKGEYAIDQFLAQGDIEHILFAVTVRLSFWSEFVRSHKSGV
ncbi:hypothetical protein [Paenibacillus sp. GCM10027629]